MSCILAFYLVAPTAARAQQADDPDALYQQRNDLRLAQKAADIWAARAASGQDFEATWKLSRACYWIGKHGEDVVRRPTLERGVKAGEQAAALAPSQPEGHFWLAANMGALAESFGLSQGLKYRGRIKSELERVLAISPSWQQGSAYRALGWWYHRVPRLFGGGEAQAETNLRMALKYNPQSTATLFFLSEVLIERGKTDEARTTLQTVLDAPLDPEWTPEDREFKEQATARLKTLAARP